MPSDDKMSVDERRKYLKLVASRYAQAGRTERSALLTEMGAVTGLHRKSLLRLLHGEPLALKQKDEHLWEIRFSSHSLGALNEIAGKITPQYKK